jgi:protein ImuB
LPQAEPAEDVMALIPEGPPRRFRWRGVTYEVEASQGPERIGAQWWRESRLSARPRDGGDEDLNSPLRGEDLDSRSRGEDLDSRSRGEDLDSRFRGNERQQALTRDYYLVEDGGGRRFWLYREGLFERETAAARWFVQGLFA